MQTTQILLSAEEVAEGIDRLAEAILDRRMAAGAVMVGIPSGGDLLAEALAAKTGIDEVGMIDITFYRDDLSRIGHHPLVHETILPDINDRTVILVDEVIRSGRTIRSAMEALFEFGRPARIILAVLIDRGERELPIQPDLTAYPLDIPTHWLVKLVARDDGQMIVTRKEVLHG
ncbi:MAG: bifunctional pyr operon transcriptional regulator/uracil phosphoribosyltransferase PyrR [Alphaproteobacteria bacterium CG_4_10_14_0_2_um_filter_63_37]|nr:MAG: hypothetical protein AUJ55_01510 [Proteobacteria bacterium CG1_02_64_396]PJA24872.1 MAG: bifunctional pyr operon transcriptional regulator/uracil phosphoribosyltransferase PyrR [Alphaproteobacteria bacterium CG_4_10_14_0_2_um_filter_63_37]